MLWRGLCVLQNNLFCRPKWWFPRQISVCFFFAVHNSVLALNFPWCCSRMSAHKGWGGSDGRRRHRRHRRRRRGDNSQLYLKGGGGGGGGGSNGEWANILPLTKMASSHWTTTIFFSRPIFVYQKTVNSKLFYLIFM